MRFGWPAYVIPFLFAYSPTLILIGEPMAIAVAAVTAAIGVWLVSVGVVGYFVRPLGPMRRGLFAVSGAALLVPAGAFKGALYTDVAGAALAVILVALEWQFARRQRLIA
jgi:TRAP-type uncharacterized transport system fused permease subunit